MLLLMIVLLLMAEPADAATWSKPVDGLATVAFAYDRQAPFERGQHRGVDLASRSGEPVRSPCTGRVTFAGRVPGRGRGLTLRCGALSATLVELRDVRPRPGAHVSRDDVVGAAGRTVHLGARRVGDAFGYVDPLVLMRPERTPLGPAPTPTRRPAPPPVAAPAVRALGRAAAPSPPATPLAAWMGLGLVLAGLPLGALVRRRSGVRRGARRVVVPR